MKILIIRFSSIGDIVLTSPVVRCVKQQVPGAEVHFLTKKHFFMLVEHNPYISKLHGLENSLKETAIALKNENFDLVIDLHNNLRSNALRGMLRKPWISYDKLNFRKWLLVKFKVDRLPRIHLVDRYFISLEKLKVENDGKGLDCFYPKEMEFELSQLPINFRNGYIAFSIGGTHNTKKLPVEKIISLCRKLQKPVVLLGGKEETAMGDEIVSALGNSVVNLCGKIHLHQSASLIRQAEIVITHDTGLMHIAAAFQKRIVSVWGNTVPAFGFYPYFGDPVKDKKRAYYAQVNDLYCRPCSKLGYACCPEKHFRCMREIDEEGIMEWVFQYPTL